MRWTGVCAARSTKRRSQWSAIFPIRGVDDRRPPPSVRGNALRMTAVVTGGPGAVFWWMTAIFGMHTKYAWCCKTLAVKYRVKCSRRMSAARCISISASLGKNPEWMALAFALLRYICFFLVSVGRCSPTGHGDRRWRSLYSVFAPSCIGISLTVSDCRVVVLGGVARFAYRTCCSRHYVACSGCRFRFGWSFHYASLKSASFIDACCGGVFSVLDTVFHYRAWFRWTGGCLSATSSPLRSGAQARCPARRVWVRSSCWRGARRAFIPSVAGYGFCAIAAAAAYVDRSPSVRPWFL